MAKAPRDGFDVRVVAMVDHCDDPKGFSPDGRVVFVPQDSTTIGLYDPGPSTARSKPAYTLSQTLPPLWNVALLPYYNKY